MMHARRRSRVRAAMYNQTVETVELIVEPSRTTEVLS